MGSVWVQVGVYALGTSATNGSTTILALVISIPILACQKES